jgi:glutamate N-acetyltransferase/amino-acid N-acetyltransferase
MPPVGGVRLGAVEAGIRYRNRADLTLAVFDEGTSVAGVLTKSSLPGEPVIWCRQALSEGGGRARALVVNAGNANVFTGKEGKAAINATLEVITGMLGCGRDQVYINSTGVIGQRLNYERLCAALPLIALDEGNWEAAARAIMTTDTFPKGATTTAEIDGHTVTINGIAKGSGMIEPDMATMLAYVFTDAAIEPRALQAVLSRANQKSFNAITVDGDMSTSDTALMFATGKAGHAPVADGEDPRLAAFLEALDTVMVDLAKQIVRDGEGAQKFITVKVRGAEDVDWATKVAKSIGNSPLVKTAIAGEDANWGRVVMAVGKTGAKADPDRLTITFGGQVVTEEGMARAGYSEERLTAHLKGREIELQVDLAVGSGEAEIWTCDLTEGYIRINADYRS